MTEYTAYRVLGRFADDALTISIAPADKSTEPAELLKINPLLLQRDPDFVSKLMALLLTSMEKHWGALKDTPS